MLDSDPRGSSEAGPALGTMRSAPAQVGLAVRPGPGWGLRAGQPFLAAGVPPPPASSLPSSVCLERVPSAIPASLRAFPASGEPWRHCPPGQAAAPHPAGTWHRAPQPGTGPAPCAPGAGAPAPPRLSTRAPGTAPRPGPGSPPPAPHSPPGPRLPPPPPPEPAAPRPQPAARSPARPRGYSLPGLRAPRPIAASHPPAGPPCPRPRRPGKTPSARPGPPRSAPP